MKWPPDDPGNLAAAMQGPSSSRCRRLTRTVARAGSSADHVAGGLHQESALISPGSVFARGALKKRTLMTCRWATSAPARVQALYDAVMMIRRRWPVPAAASSLRP